MYSRRRKAINYFFVNKNKVVSFLLKKRGRVCTITNIIQQYDIWPADFIEEAYMVTFVFVFYFIL